LYKGSALANLKKIFNYVIFSPTSLSLFHKIVLALSVLLTVMFWAYSNNLVEEKIKLQFTKQSDELVETILSRLSHYEDALWGSVAFLEASPSKINFSQWQRYAQGLDIIQRYPGINGVGVIFNVYRHQLPDFLAWQQQQRPKFDVHPKLNHPRLLVKTYISPVEGNAPAIGLDISSENTSLEAANLAMQSGRAVMSAPMVLAQDKNHTPGFLLFMPFYAKQNLTSVIEREQYFVGFVFAPFIMQKLISGTLNASKRLLELKISDNGQYLFQDKIGNSLISSSRTALNSKHIKTVFGRKWVIETYATEDFLTHFSSNQPLIILVTGLLINFLLIVFFLQISYRKQQKELQLLQMKTDYFTKTQDERELKSRLELALKASEIGVWQYNIKDAQISWDESMFKLYGVDSEDFDGAYQIWENSLHPDDKEKSVRMLNDAIKYNHKFDMVFRILLPRRGIRYIKALADVFYIDDEPIKVIGVNWDVTEEIEHEEQLKVAQANALAASEAKTMFLANMSHEIRTPMNAIIGFSELVLNDTELSIQSRKHINTVLHSSKDLLKIIDDILDVSKLESGKVTLEHIQFNLRQIISQLVDIISPLVQEKKLLLHCYWDDDLPEYMVGSPLHLKQVLLNLLSNAVKFTESGNIDFNVIYDAPQKLVTFEVSDQGIGIDPLKISNIFKAFTQEENSTTRRFGGTGLGLSIAKSLVDLMGGNLLVDSQKAYGSRFYFSLKVDGVAIVQLEKSAEPERKIIELKPGLHVLIAEDNDDNALLVSELLKQHGMTYDRVYDGEQAVEAFKERAYDLVLMDIMMPNMDGIAATQAIRQLEREQALSSIPIIAVTANAMKKEIEQYLQSGFDAVVTKSVANDNLISVIFQLQK
jgi:signal transduction histidine kinase/CheY-like chemotaxis protein/CHASE1-domain containing sensor protein